MSVLSSMFLPAIKKRLPKVISPTMHGFIDYSHATFFLGMAIVCRKNNKPAALAALGTGALVLVQSLLTDYPLGVVPLLSFEDHGKMDAAFASASWAIPKLFGFGDTPAAKVFESNTVVEGLVVSLTDFSDGRAKQEEV